MCGMVAAHNSVRATAPNANPALPLMTWDATLAAFAQTYASTCPAGHNPNRTIEGQTAGENMYFTSQRNPVAPAQVVQGWASEQANYAYPANTCGGAAYTSATFSCTTCPECGHYTQIVWRTTIKVGCGVATTCSGSFPQVWVCDYLPAGNMIDRNGNLQLPY
jgi:pathogenesis-related protein 1